ncbi:MAG: hypothetical protein JO013_13250 [Alphaproteobacteria bacterium]|nr:hypothetical protein [Alphaproteobacteria bacterium]
MSLPLRAELRKQLRQRGSLVWGFAAVPLFSTFAAFVLELAIPSTAGVGTAVHPVRSAIRAVSLAGNPVAQLFYAVGAAAFFTVEYRHATWRLIVPRAPRGALFGAKALGFCLLAAASLLLLLAGDLAASLAVPLVRKVAVTDAPPATLAHLGLACAVSLAELVALGGTAALLAVLTRSQLGTLLPVFLLAFFAAGAEAVLNLSGNALAAIPLPTLAADAVRSWLAATPDAPGASSAAAAIGAAVLGLWSVLSYGLAAFLFARQDLARE